MTLDATSTGEPVIRLGHVLVEQRHRNGECKIFYPNGDQKLVANQRTASTMIGHWAKRHSRRMTWTLTIEWRRGGITRYTEIR